MMYLWVAVGSALGGMARFWFSGFIAARFGETFPWGTFTVNVLGSLIIGFVATISAPDGRVFIPAAARTFILVGFCGGYTTFSSFSLQTLALLRDGEWLAAAGNIVFSVVICLVAVTVGHFAAQWINQMDRL